MTAIRVERLDASHFARVAALHGRVFHSRLAAEDVRRKYATGHTGLENIGFVALEDTRVLAFHGAIPQEFECDGQPLLVGQTCDSMADPSVRGRGLYGDLFLRTEALLVESGATLMYGFANEGSLRAMRKLGWSCVAQTLNRYSFRVRTAPAARLMWKLPALRPLFSRLVRSAFADAIVPLDGFESSLAGQGWLAHRYTPAELEYKRRLPSLAVRIGEARLWLGATPQLMLGDLHVPDVASLRLALGGLTSRARRLGITDIHCFACPGVRLDGMLAQLVTPRAGMVVLTGTTGSHALAEKLRVNLADADTF